MTDWAVGQEVYIVPSDKRDNPSTEVIARVARKWAYFDKNWKGRFCKETGHIDGGDFSSPGRVWPSPEAYEAHCLKQKKWGAIRQALMHAHIVPPHLTEFDLDLIADLLNKKVKS